MEGPLFLFFSFSEMKDWDHVIIEVSTFGQQGIWHREDDLRAPEIDYLGFWDFCLGNVARVNNVSCIKRFGILAQLRSPGTPPFAFSSAKFFIRSTTSLKPHTRNRCPLSVLVVPLTVDR